MCANKWPVTTHDAYIGPSVTTTNPGVVRQSVIVRAETTTGGSYTRHNGKSPTNISSNSSSVFKRRPPKKKLQDGFKAKDDQHQGSVPPATKWMSRAVDSSASPYSGEMGSLYHSPDSQSWDDPQSSSPLSFSWSVEDLRRYQQYGRATQASHQLNNYEIDPYDSSLCNLDAPNRPNPRSISSHPSQHHIGLDFKNCSRMFPLAMTGQQFETYPNAPLDRYPVRDFERSGHRVAYHEQSPQHHSGFPFPPSNVQPGPLWVPDGPPHSSASCHPNCHEMPQDRIGNSDIFGLHPSSSNSIIQADNDGDIALHIAVAKEEEDNVAQFIEMMLNSRMSIDICNKMHQSSLHIAVITRNVNIIRRLLMAGASAALPDRHGNTAVHLAVYCSTHEVLKTLLDSPLALKAIHRYNYNGFTPLHLAVFRRDLDAISLLVAKGADCNCVDGTSGRTPLFHAVLNSQDDVVARLICLGASVNLPNFAGITPLVIATDRRLKNITSLLISKGATVTCREDTQN